MRKGKEEKVKKQK